MDNSELSSSVRISQIAYEAYEACWNSNNHVYMTHWAELSSKEKQAWEEASIAAIEEYRRVNEHSGSWVLDDGET